MLYGNSGSNNNKPHCHLCLQKASGGTSAHGIYSIARKVRNPCQGKATHPAASQIQTQSLRSRMEEIKVRCSRAFAVGSNAFEDGSVAWAQLEITRNGHGFAVISIPALALRCAHRTSTTNHNLGGAKAGIRYVAKKIYYHTPV